MTITHTLTLQVSNLPQTTVDVTADGEDNRDPTINAMTNDVEVQAAFTAAALKSIYIVSDVTVTLETNSSSAPDNTFTITANKPFVWYADSGITCPFTATVTKFFFSNGTAGAASVRIRIAKDATP